MADLFIIPSHDVVLYNLHLELGKKLICGEAQRGRVLRQRKYEEIQRVVREVVDEMFDYIGRKEEK